MRHEELLPKDFKKTVANGIHAVLFYTEWSPVCNQMFSDYKSATNNTKCYLHKMDTDAHLEFASTLGIKLVPFTAIYIDGEQWFTKPGLVHHNELLNMLEKAKVYKTKGLAATSGPEKSDPKDADAIKTDTKEEEPNMLAIAYRIAAVAFENKADKGGRAYFSHCLKVAEGVAHLGIKYEIAGVLHDVVEDTDITLKDLFKAGFCADVINALDCLTHRKGEDYQDYIIRAGSNIISRYVKISDLDHNSQIHRMKGLRAKDFKRLEKYHFSYKYLCEL